MMLVFVVLALLGSAQAEESLFQNNSRKAEPRLFSFFNVIRFQNNPCNTTTGTAGVCYTSAECLSKGGTNGGSCAAGYGVCCQFQIGCGQTSSANCTYFVSGDADTSPCTAKICRCNSNICQLRLDFNSFTIAQPSSLTAVAATNAATQPQAPRTECQNAWFTASSDGTNPAAICGTNTGYHMYVEASALCNDLTFSWSSTDVRGWNIKVCQIACDDPNKPPEGCTQWFTGTTNTISSYNYQGGIHLANQNQMSCIRTELGYCSANFWQTTPTSFGVSGSSTPSTTGLTGSNCAADYVQVVTPVNYLFNQFCGSFFGNIPTSAMTAPINIPNTITTSMQPFYVRFVTDSGETDGAPGTDSQSKGFQITYQEVAC